MELLGEATPVAVVAGMTFLLVSLYLLTSTVSMFLQKTKYAPVAGTIFHLLFNLHRLHDFLTDFSCRFKTFRFRTPTSSYIYTVDPCNVEYILKTNFANFGKGFKNYEIMKDLLGDGIFAVDGERWQHQRKVASSVFSATILRNYNSIVFRDNASKLCELIFEAANSSKKIDIQELLMKSTMDSAFKLGFGVELDTLFGSNNEGRIFAKAFDDANIQTFRRYVDVFWKVKRLLNFGSEAKLRKNVILINDFIYNVINKKIDKISGTKNESMKKEEDILSRLLMEREKNPNTISYQYVRDVVLNIFFAGRDTTAATLSCFFYLLCKHPNVQQKVVKVLREAIMGKENLTMKEFHEFFTDQVLNNMHYLHAALTETLRLYPAVPLNGKQCFSNDKFPDGFNVKKGDLVIYQPYPMGRMKFIWGEDAEQFRPERWLNAHGHFLSENPYKFPAFQAGPRICLGKDFAYLQMKIFAATLLYYFKFDLAVADQTINCKPMMTLQIDGGLHLRASARINN